MNAVTHIVPTHLAPNKERTNLSPFLNSIFQLEIPMLEFERMGKLPVFYYDNTSITAAFTASTKAVKALLPDPDMHPIEVFPGRTVVTFSCFEYRDTDIDPYNELGIGFLISHGKKRLPGLPLLKGLINKHFEAFVWQLPVTTEIARWGGVELYGFPKFVADIDFTRNKKTTRIKLAVDGSHILTLEGKNLSTRPQKNPMRYGAYSTKDGHSLCANVYTNPLQYAQTLMPNAATLELGTHPIADTLRTLKLSKRPLMYQYCPKNELVLFGPRNLIDN